LGIEDEVDEAVCDGSREEECGIAVIDALGLL
jgi:hypothetical protein